MVCVYPLPNTENTDESIYSWSIPHKFLRFFLSLSSTHLAMRCTLLFYTCICTCYPHTQVPPLQKQTNKQKTNKQTKKKTGSCRGGAWVWGYVRTCLNSGSAVGVPFNRTAVSRNAKSTLRSLWIRPPTWLPFVHEIATSISWSPQQGWWGWYWLKHVLHSGWLCVTSQACFFFFKEMWFIDRSYQVTTAGQEIYADMKFSLHCKNIVCKKIIIATLHICAHASHVTSVRKNIICELFYCNGTSFECKNFLSYSTNKLFLTSSKIWLHMSNLWSDLWCWLCALGI